MFSDIFGKLEVAEHNVDRPTLIYRQGRRGNLVPFVFTGGEFVSDAYYDLCIVRVRNFNRSTDGCSETKFPTPNSNSLET